MSASAGPGRQVLPSQRTHPIPIEWTPRLVAAFLADAAQRHGSLGERELPETLKTWSKVTHPGLDMHFDAKRASRSRPLSPRAMAQRKAALCWLQWLDDDVQRMAWDRANGRPWKAIAHAHGVDRSTAWRRWTCAMVMIAARLNAQ